MDSVSAQQEPVAFKSEPALLMFLLWDHMTHTGIMSGMPRPHPRDFD